MVATTARDFIGRGWSYPVRFDPRTGGVSKDQGEGTEQKLKRVRNALRTIMQIKRGEFFFARRFGARIRDLIFSLSTSNLADRIKFELYSAFEDQEYGEHRAVISKMDVILPGFNRESADVDITFLLRRENAESNVVYPFYLRGEERTAAEEGLTSG